MADVAPVEKDGAKDSTARRTPLPELAAMQPRRSQDNPGSEIPEKNLYSPLVKRFWFNDFGVYDGRQRQTPAAV